MSNANPEDLSDDQLEEAQRAADGEVEGVSEDDTTEHQEGESTTDDAGNGEQQQTTDESATTEGAETGEATEQQTTDAEAQASAVAAAGKPTGVASKDGTRVLPYSALQAERRSHRQAAARAERAETEASRLRQEVEDLRAGKSKGSEQLTEDEVQRMEAEFPDEGKKLRAAFERTKELEQQIAAAAPKAATEDEVGDDPVQDAIDQVPMLLEWQHDPQHADKWQRAIVIDEALKDSPKWKSKPAVDRFAHVTRMVAEEFDIEVPEQTAPKPQRQSGATQGATRSSTTTTKPSPDPKDVAARAERQPPSTLSDLKGGSVPDHGELDLNRATPQRLLGRFMEMSNDEIDAQLAKLG